MSTYALIAEVSPFLAVDYLRLKGLSHDFKAKNEGKRYRYCLSKMNEIINVALNN